MKVLGIDIGTTTISAVVLEGEKLLSSLTLPNSSFINTVNPWEKVQSPEYIIKVCYEALDRLMSEHDDIGKIGITGQMHGILYINAEGRAVSPLYTWQDGRGDLPCGENGSYAQQLSGLTGYAVATGYGMLTHYYNTKNCLVPSEALMFCTIPDYLAMQLCGLAKPLMDASMAASLGLFSVEKLCFDLEAVTDAGLSTDMLPPLADKPCIGTYRDIPVCTAIGDNQASFIGACSGTLESMLVNVGTGSQFSAYSGDYMGCEGLETRPFPGGGYLLVGASLCGGRAYALLEKFIRDTASAVCGEVPDSGYEAMEQLLSMGKPDDLPLIVPLFQGTRQQPDLRGSISGLSTANFTPRHFVWAMLYGMVKELHDMYLSYLSAGGQAGTLVGSGNGLRKNAHMQSCFSELFAQSLTMSACNEEAAVGAARFTLMN